MAQMQMPFDIAHAQMQMPFHNGHAQMCEEEKKAIRVEIKQKKIFCVGFPAKCLVPHCRENVELKHCGGDMKEVWNEYEIIIPVPTNFQNVTIPCPSLKVFQNREEPHKFLGWSADHTKVVCDTNLYIWTEDPTFPSANLMGVSGLSVSTCVFLHPVTSLRIKDCGKVIIDPHVILGLLKDCDNVMEAMNEKTVVLKHKCPTNNRQKWILTSAPFC